MRVRVLDCTKLGVSKLALSDRWHFLARFNLKLFRNKVDRNRTFIYVAALQLRPEIVLNLNKGIIAQSYYHYIICE